MMQASQDVMDRLNKTSLLSAELINNYGSERVQDMLSKSISYEENGSGRRSQPKLSTEIINHRQKDYAKKKDKYSENLRQLNSERLKLIEEREKVEERRRLLAAKEAKSLNSDKSNRSKVPHRRTEAQDLDSLIQNATQNITKQAGRLWQLREDYNERQRKLYKPYNGELGISSYQPWQIPHYNMVKSIVEDVIERVLDQNFTNSYMTDTAGRAFRQKERSQLQKVQQLSAEQKATQLVCESLILQTTAQMMSEISQEVSLVYSMVQSMTNVSFMNMIESLSAEKGETPAVSDARSVVDSEGGSLAASQLPSSEAPEGRSPAASQERSPALSEGRSPAVSEPRLTAASQARSTAISEGRSTNDPLYDQVTKSFLRRQAERDKFRKDKWGHSQPSYFIGRRGLVFEDESDEEPPESEPQTSASNPPADSRQITPGTRPQTQSEDLPYSTPGPSPARSNQGQTPPRSERSHPRSRQNGNSQRATANNNAK